MGDRPIIEEIARDLVTALEMLTADNGYSYPLASVTRPPSLGITAAPGHLEAVLVQSGQEAAGELDTVGNPAGLGLRQEFAVAVAIRLPDESSLSFDAVANVVAADVRKVLLADVTRGGHAHDTVVGRPEPFAAEDGSYEGVALTVSVTYRIQETDPYTIA